MSLQPGLDEKDVIHIINDRTTHDTLTWMKDHSKAWVHQFDIRSLDELRKNHPYPDYQDSTRIRRRVA